VLLSSPVDGFRLAYARQGSGPPVVLLHGWPGDHGDWTDVAALLGDGVDLVVPDLRGFGESDKHPEAPASIAWYRAGSGAVATSLAERAPAPEDRIAAPTSVLWPEHDPLFPRKWSDRIPEFFSDATLLDLAGVGHFSPLEAPRQFARAIAAAFPADHSGV
jgi:pimeloyl-ACP methyl ester carboxylesterase